MVEDAHIICPVCGHHNPADASFCQNDGVALLEGDPDDPLVGRLVGNYRLKERKGEGGFGVVYRAEHRELHTQYAVKILHPQFSANAHVAERFRREAAAAGRLRHENVVHIADFGQAKGLGYYYVMEFLDGKTLKDTLDLEEPFYPERIVHIAEQVTSAMERVHELNIIHRDLKPENIFLITKDTKQDHVKLVDFGIAKIMDDGGASITRTGLSVGTPLYMSPEQARGLLKDLDRRSDIYSWGIILFELLTYQPPFFSENPHDVVMLQIRATPPRLSDTHPYRRFSEGLEDFFQRILSKKRQNRPSTMTEAFDEFTELILAPDAYYDVDPRSNQPIFPASTAEGNDEHTLSPEANNQVVRLAQADSVQSTSEHILREQQDAKTILYEASSEDEDEEQTKVSSHPGIEALGPEDEIAPIASSDDLPVAVPPPPPAAFQKGAKTSLLLKEDAQKDIETDPSLQAVAEAPKPRADGPDKPSLDDLFDGLPLGEEDVASVRTSATSVRSTSEALYLGSESLATDPNALHSPLRRHWAPLSGAVALVVLALLLWVGGTKTPPPPRKGPALFVDAGSTPATRREPLQKRDTQSNPSPRPPTPTPPAKKVQAPLPAPQPRARSKPAPLAPRREKAYRLLIRSTPAATCYAGLAGRRRRRIGRTPCKIRGKEGQRLSIRVTRSKHVSYIRFWNVRKNARWSVRLKPLQPKASPRARAQPRDRAPTPRRTGDNIFGKTPNPFKDKPKKRPKK